MTRPSAEEIDIRQSADGVSLTIKVRPGASKTGPAGVRAGALLMDVAAAPEKGKANAELLRWLRRHLETPAEKPRIRAGQLARHKVIFLAGMKSPELRLQLQTCLQALA